jgi:hypothetical protein
MVRSCTCQERAVLMKSGGFRSPVTADPDERTPVGINLGIGAAMIVGAGMVAAPIAAQHIGWRFAIVAVAVACFAVLTLDRLALAGVVALGWLVVNGFLVDRLGELSWHGSSDLYRLMLLVMAGALGLAIGEAYRYVRDLRARWRSGVDEPMAVTFFDEEKCDG